MQNYQKRKIIYRSDSFWFLMTRAQISNFNSEIPGLLSSVFLFKAVSYDKNFKYSSFFSAILASSKNSLSIES